MKSLRVRIREQLHLTKIFAFLFFSHHSDIRDPGVIPQALQVWPQCTGEQLNINLSRSPCIALIFRGKF